MAVEKINKINLFGQEYVLSGSNGTAGGSGGGGLALTGGAYVGAEGGITSTNRWLRFDFNDSNHKSLVILGGTSFTIGENIVTIDETTSYNLSDYISEEGADYYVFINAEGRLVANTIRTPAEGYMFIGQFHTLCNSVPVNTTALVYEGKNILLNEKLTIGDYGKNTDLDFYNFYTKIVDSETVGSYYNVGSVLHPLQGFNTGDILPESVCCLNFHPKCKNWDGMVYCNTLEKFVDIYLQSGTGRNTRSEYGAVHTPVGYSYLNILKDCDAIGKEPFTVLDFYKFSLGSNQLTSIYGDTDVGVIGGHVDTANRRMISFIGCEECCGYVSQYSYHLSEFQEYDTWYPLDYQGGFGQYHDIVSSLNLGGGVGYAQGVAGSMSGGGVGGLTSGAAQISLIGGRFMANLSIV